MERVRSSAIPGAALLAITATLAACVGRPWLALWPLGSYDVDEIERAAPAELRVAINLPRPLQPRSGATSLTMRLESSGGDTADRELRLPLTLVSQGDTVRARRLRVADPGYMWHLFKLTPRGERALRSLQREIDRSNGDFARRFRRVTLHVDTTIQDVAPGQTYAMSVWVQMDTEIDFELLWEDRRVQGQPATMHSDGRGS